MQAVEVDAQNAQANLDGFRRFEAYCQLTFYDAEKEVHHCWALAAMRGLQATYTLGELTSQSLWSRYDRHFVGIT